MQGRVFRKAIGRYWVKTGGSTVVCSLSSKLRKHLVYPTADPSSIRRHVVAVAEIAEVDPVAIGDEVVFIESGAETGMITEVLPRRNKLSRKAADKRPLEQVIAANLDQMVAIMAAAHPEPKWRLLDRYLANAEFLEIPVLVCITKTDLSPPQASPDPLCGSGRRCESDPHARLGAGCAIPSATPNQESSPTYRNSDRIGERIPLPQTELKVYSDIGYHVILTSAVTGAGIAELKTALKNKVSVFMGKSGVGKTSLLNALQPELGLAVQEVNERTDKGRHTTSNLEMFELDFGGFVVDTPGMREFGLWNPGNTDVTGLFREMRPYIGQCRFGASCTHSHEPQCAIKDAVAAQRISPMRYDSYLRMKRGA